MGDAQMVRALLVLLLVAPVVLAGVVVVKAILSKCAQPDVLPPAPVSLDKMNAAERLSEAVRFKTISYQDPREFDSEAFVGLRAFLERTFPNVHRNLTREVVNHSSLLYTWKGANGGHKPVLLMAHLDVVPVEPATEGKWAHPPFSGRVADGYVWGRGTMDLKVSVLGMLEAVELLVAQGFRPSRTVYLAFGHDEEIGGNQGAAKIAALLKSRGVRLEYVLDEGSVVGHGLIPGILTPVAMVGIAEKGYVTLELTAEGPGGHSSMPPREGAISILSTAVSRLEANPMPATITGAVWQLLTCVAQDTTFGRRMILANLWLFEPLVKRQLTKSSGTNALIRTTMAVTMLHSGAKENLVPTEAKAVVNLRILPGDSFASATDHVRRVIDDPRVRIMQTGGIEPSPVSDTAAASFRILSVTVRQVFPNTVVAPILSIVGTDSKHYAPLTDATYRFLPLRLKSEDLARIHGTNERVAMDNYAEVIKFYFHLIRNSAS